MAIYHMQKEVTIMELIYAGENLEEKIKHVTMYTSCQGDTCDSHDGCGEQCNHSYCRY